MHRRQHEYGSETQLPLAAVTPLAITLSMLLRQPEGLGHFRPVDRPGPRPYLGSSEYASDSGR